MRSMPVRNFLVLLLFLLLSNNGIGDNSLFGNVNAGAVTEGMNGSAGNDTIIFGSTSDQLISNGDFAGNDFISCSSVDFSKSTTTDFLPTTFGDDFINRSNGSDVFTTGDGIDVLFGRAGNDTLNAGGGNKRACSATLVTTMLGVIATIISAARWC